jgi:DNA polymerase III delta prime subunit
MVRVGEILAREEIEFDVENLQTFVKVSYPDLRKTINNVQLNCADNKLTIPEQTDDTSDYKIEMITLFKAGKIKEARRLICNQIRQDEYEDVFKFLYRNLEFWGNSSDKQDEAIVIIRNGLVKHGMIADPEINLSATLIELENISN